MKQLGLEWPRWVLVVCNGLFALACLVLAAIANGYADVAPSVLLAIASGVVAFREARGHGLVLQTLMSVVALAFAVRFASVVPIGYAVFALLSVWWLGDFRSERIPPDVSPEHVAQLLSKRGKNAEEIRAALVERSVPAAKIEEVVYALVSRQTE